MNSHFFGICQILGVIHLKNLVQGCAVQRKAFRSQVCFFLS